MRFLIAFSLTTIAAQAIAQERPTVPPVGGDFQKHSDEHNNWHGSLFIAPSGKPFRSPPGAPYPMEAWFAQADTNHDGRLTLAEIRNDATRFFAELDTNHDGEIDPEEVRVYETVMVPEIQTGGFGGGGGMGFPVGGGAHRAGSRHGGGGGGGGMGRRKSDANQETAQATHSTSAETQRGAGRYGLIDTPEPVTAADTDIDRSITLKEFRAKAADDFQELDTKQVGYLTLADLPTPTAESHPNARRRPHR